jgi:hypothetical protein
MYHRKMEKWMRSVKSVKTPMPPELFDDKKRSLPQVQTSNWPMRTGQRQSHSSDAMMIHLVPTDYVCEISSWTSSATDLTFTTHRRPIWVPLSPS